MRPPRDTQVERAFAGKAGSQASDAKRGSEARVGAKSRDVSQEQPAETNSLPKRLPSRSAEAASEARSEAKPSEVNKGDFVLARFARGRSKQGEA